jgi:HSP20 family protein
MRLLRFGPDLDPFAALLRLQEELDRALEAPVRPGMVSGRGLFPPMNVFSDREGYVVHFEVPGVPPEALSIETQGRTLTLAGKREATPPGEGSYHRAERGTGEFSRSLELPEDADLERVEATCRHGILTVRVPKRQEAKPRQIAVKAA